MKQVKLIITSLLASIFLFSTPIYAYDPANSGISYSPTSDSMIYTNTQNFNQGAIVNAFNTLPENLRNLLRKEGVKIYYTDGVTREQRGYAGTTVGFTVSYYENTNKVVRVDQRARIYVYPDTEMSLTIPHECGHAFDGIASYITGKYVGDYGISSTQEWMNIFNKNSAALATVDARMSNFVNQGANEAFAEAFRLYCTNPNGLNAACPEVYNFISAQIAKYAGGAPAPSSTGITKKNFDAKAYADTYPDLKAAFGYDKNALWNHYISYGKAEGRTVTAVQ